MTRISLTGGAYQAHSVIAAAQRQVNLYSEPMPSASTEPQRMALYPTPGLRLLGTMAQAGIRGGWQASNGAVYVVAGNGVYSLDTSWSGTLLGSITAGKHTPVSMCDNGLDLVIVDGSAHGWKVTLASNAFAQIDDPTNSFRGGDRVDFLDTYFVFNVPGTPQFQASDSLAVTFDPLWFANKEGFSDLLQTLVVAKRQIWLLGRDTSEVFFNSGAADFPFQSFPNIIIDHGCAAKYSAAEIDNAAYWLAQDRRGQGVVIQGAGYETTRISTFAIEQELATYERIDDAIGFTYLLAGHLFYVLTFPHADKTWAYDISTKLWHEWVWIDANGSEHRHRTNCLFSARGLVVAGDWQNGNLYAVDPGVYTDNTGPIKRLRRYPHTIADGRRVFYRKFLADIESGNDRAETVSTETVTLQFGSREYLALTPLTPSLFASSWTSRVAVDYAAGKAYIEGRTPNGLIVFDVATMEAEREQLMTDVLTAGDSGGVNASSTNLLIGPDDALYFQVTDRIVRVDTATLIETAEFPAAFGITWTSANFPFPGLLASLRYLLAAGGHVDLLLATGAGAAFAAWGALALPGMTHVAHGATSGLVRGSVAGKVTLARGDTWVMSGPGGLPGGTTWIDRISASEGAPTPVLTQMAAITPTMVNPGTTTFLVNDYRALVYDDSDDALIFSCTTSADGLTSAGTFLVKWSAADGIVWRTQLPAVPDAAMDHQSRITDGTLALFLVGYVVQVDTGSGLILVQQDDWPISQLNTVQIYDSVTQSVLGNFNQGDDPGWARTLPTEVTTTTSVATNDLIFLSWSDDRGHSYGNPVGQSLGLTGQYLTSVQWRRLGLARDRVFEIEWSLPRRTALQGAWIDAEAARS